MARLIHKARRDCFVVFDTPLAKQKGEQEISLVIPKGACHMRF